MGAMSISVATLIGNTQKLPESSIPDCFPTGPFENMTTVKAHPREGTRGVRQHVRREYWFITPYTANFENISLGLAMLQMKSHHAQRLPDGRIIVAYRNRKSGQGLTEFEHD